MLKLLFICTHNRCRSILCEALTRHLSNGRISAYSAGSQPSGAVHPQTLAQLEKRGINTSGLCSESWDSYSELPIDAVITVCDSAAGEPCPLWLGKSVRAHWGLPDPSCITGTDAESDAAFDDVIRTIEHRILRLLSLKLEDLSGDALAASLQLIAQQEP